MSKEVDKREEKFYLDEALDALDYFLNTHYWGREPIEELLDRVYIERQANEQWQCVPSCIDKQIKYEIIETGKDKFDSFPYYVREWHEIDADCWAYTGEGIFCNTLEQANEYIAAQDGKAALGNIVKIIKSDENIREVSQENGKDKIFIKKYGIWWPAYKNEKEFLFLYISRWRIEKRGFFWGQFDIYGTVTYETSHKVTLSILEME